jgi:restriction endonuclease S subunit
VREFIFHFLASQYDAIRSLSNTGNQENLNSSLVRSISVLLPPETQQGTIAAALSDVDALLAGLTRLIAKKRDLKQAAMQRLLTGQSRLPGFSGEWQMKQLGKCLLARPDYGINAAAVPFSDHLPSYIRITDISQDGRYCPDPRVSVRAASAEQYYLHKGDVVFARTGASVGKSYLYQPSDGDLVFAGFLIRVRSNPEVLTPAFLAAYAMTNPYWNWVNLMSMRSGQPGINGKEYTQLPLPLPTIHEQTAIVAVLSDMDAELAALEGRRDKTRALKQAIMQELLTGKTRLVEPGVETSRKDSVGTSDGSANIHFKRSVLAAEIVDRLYEEPTFGHVKFEKTIFLVEHLCKIDTGSTYHRNAAGPYDNRAIRSIDSQLRKQEWFDAQELDGRYRYVPMAKRGGHKKYFERYFCGIRDSLERILSTLRTFDTERCEIIATLFAAWDDLMQQHASISDDAIVHEVLNNWHESKKRIPDERWRKALAWMRDKGFAPPQATGEQS